MEQIKKVEDGGADILPLIHKIKSKWYWFAISTFFFLVIAVGYSKLAEKKYAVQGSILFEAREIGSTDVDELLDDRNQNTRRDDKTIALSNEIAKLTSDNMVGQAIDKLDSRVTYFTAGKIWPGFLKKNGLQERYKDFPIEVVIDSSQFQLVGALIFVEYVSDTQVNISVEAEEVRAYNFETQEFSGIIPSVSFSEIITVGEKLQTSYLSIEIRERPRSMISKDEFDLAFRINSDKSLVDSYKSKLSVSPVDETDQASRVVNLSMEINIPAKGEDFINALIDTYSNSVLFKKNLKGENSLEFIDRRLAILSDSLKEAELALQSFKSNSAVVDVDYAKNSLYNRLDRVEQEKARIDDQLNYYRSTLRAFDTPGS
ncbi:MAG: hypothetical protein ACFB15_13410 [Cyclobacteriaceae bacterium]